MPRKVDVEGKILEYFQTESLMKVQLLGTLVMSEVKRRVAQAERQPAPKVQSGLTAVHTSTRRKRHRRTKLEMQAAAATAADSSKGRSHKKKAQPAVPPQAPVPEVNPTAEAGTPPGQ